MSLLRTSFRAARPAARAFSSTPATAERWSTQHVQPADVVAGKATGPATIHESARDITADVVSDAPQELRHRGVRIYKPTKNTMQSGKGKTKVWRIDWDTLQGAGRWTNPLMGWQSSADYMQGTSLVFRTQEDAVRFVSGAQRGSGASEGGPDWRSSWSDCLGVMPGAPIFSCASQRLAPACWCDWRALGQC